MNAVHRCAGLCADGGGEVRKKARLTGSLEHLCGLVQSLVAVCGGPGDVVSALRVYSLGKKTDTKHGMELKLTS